MTDTPTTLSNVLREFADTVNVGEPYEIPSWIKLTRLAEAIHPRLYTVPMAWIRESAACVADALTPYDVDDFPTRRHEYVADAVDGLVDTVTTDLVAWVGLGPWTLELMDDARIEIGTVAVDDAYTMIQNGEKLALRRLSHAILELCEARAEELEEERARRSG